MKNKWKLLKKIHKDQRIDSAARCVYFFLLDRENNITKKLFPSHARLADDTGLHIRSVQRSIKLLIDYDYISKIKKGYPGRASEYKINYDISPDNLVVNTRQAGRFYPTHKTHQLTNELTNKLTMDDKVKNILGSITKNMNPNYRAVVDGNKKPYNHPDSIEARMMRKTDDYNKTKAWRKLYDNPSTKNKAIAIAKHLGIIREYKKNGR